MLTRSRPYLTGLIGAGIGTSLSPPLHEREAAELGLRYAYRTLDLDVLGAGGDRGLAGRDVLGELLARAVEAGYDGLNVTHPGKQRVLEHLDELDEDAAALGAVNTIVIRDGRTKGHNTDTIGFAESVERGLPGVSLERVVLLGAGGAGSALAHALKRLGAGELTIVDADGEKARALAEAVGGRCGAAEDVAHADGLVHATPTGMEGHPGIALDPGLLHERLWVADIVYRPLETTLLRAARARGCRTLNGGGMVVLQAAASLELFTGAQADRERMLRHFAELTA
jgi:quinate/shikimate dehydrogenase (NAD+)